MKRTMESGANISECGKYRTRLWRIWNTELPRLCFIMLNPSTAGPLLNDATIDWCIAYAMANGFGGVEVVNLYTFRTVSPAVLKKNGYPVGPHDDITIVAVASTVKDQGGRVICAWGANAQPERAEHVRDLLLQRGIVVHHLGLNKDGSPKHPLYRPRATPMTEWWPFA